MDALGHGEREDELTDEEVHTLEAALAILQGILSRSAQRRDALQREVAELQQKVEDAHILGRA